MSDMSGAVSYSGALVLVGKTTLGGKTYTVNDSNGTILKKAMNLPDSWYGGSVKEFRKVKDSGILMCLDRRDRVINLAYRDHDLTDEDRELLGLPKLEMEEVPEQGEGQGQGVPEQGEGQEQVPEQEAEQEDGKEEEVAEVSTKKRK